MRSPISRIVRGDLRFQIGDLLQLAARGVGDRFVSDVNEQRIGRER